MIEMEMDEMKKHSHFEIKNRFENGHQHRFITASNYQPFSGIN